MQIPLLDSLIYAAVGSKLPPISSTEIEALSSGTDADGWYAELMSGSPNWNKLFALSKPELTEDEQAFIDGPVEELCEMIDKWELAEEKEIPEEIMTFMKDNKFFGMVVPKEYDGLGFSALGHSAAVMKLASRSAAVAVTAMVPNSLGPAELLAHYGTQEQRDYYLPKLATGELIPCFGLTELMAGSDAAAIRANGVVFKDDNDEVKIKLNFEKRYITLAPIADLVGLAFKLEDPEGLLPEGTLKEDDPNITAALLRVQDDNGNKLDGLNIGNRLDPSGIRFMNGTVVGEDVVISPDDIIGGAPNAGKGWGMLMESLGVGRSISLPSISEAASKLSNLVTLSRPRRQFNLEVNKFEGIQNVQARMLGKTYLMNATRLGTMAMIDQNKEKPTIPSAVAKYTATEDNRKVINDAYDILAGQAIIRGPSNIIEEAYRAIPIGITVEGANRVTSTIIMGGQAIVRTHPYFFNELMAARDKDKAKLRNLVMHHVASSMMNMMRSVIHSYTGGFFSNAPTNDNKIKKYYKQINRLSAVFNVISDISFGVMGGALKRKECIAERIGAMGGDLYRASLALWAFEESGSPEDHRPMMEWAVQHALSDFEENLEELLKNYPNKFISFGLRALTKPFLYRTVNQKPSDKMDQALAKKAGELGGIRDFVKEDIFISKNDNDPLTRMIKADAEATACAPIHAKLKDAKYRVIDDNVLQDSVLQTAVDDGVISSEEADRVRQSEELILNANKVDVFDRKLQTTLTPS